MFPFLSVDLFCHLQVAEMYQRQVTTQAGGGGKGKKKRGKENAGEDDFW